MTVRFGYFLAPYHRPGFNPTLAFERDLELGKLCDKLGFSEFWVGEHHSGGWEVIGSPEIFLAVLAERTRHIRLGSGVVSAPYHHPFHVATRAVMLDHLTRGRCMLGLGPGQLATDMHMQGIDVMETRPRLNEAMDVIRRLLAGEKVTHESEWFTLRDARLQIAPYSENGIELAVTGSISPNGAKLAGSSGSGLLSMAATTPEGVGALQSHWRAYSDSAAAQGVTPDRGRWRLVGPMHLAETREQAEAEVAWGLEAFCKYFNSLIPGGILPGENLEEIFQSNRERQFAVIGTPQDAIDRIEQLVEKSGGFGTYLLMGHDWARPDRLRNSLQLFADEVMPHLTGQTEAQAASYAWADQNADEFAATNFKPFAGMPSMATAPSAQSPDVADESKID